MSAAITTNIYTQGTAVTIATVQPFTAIDGVTIIDPDVVMFGFQIDGEASQTYTFTYTYGTGDPTNTIIRTGIGSYQATFDTSLYSAGVWVYSVACQPSTAINHDATKTKVRQMGQLIVEAAPF
jgi:hypothetical protein